MDIAISKKDQNSQLYEEHVTWIVAANQKRAHDILNDNTITSSFLEQNFSTYKKAMDFTGALYIKNKPENAILQKFFFDNKQKVFETKWWYISRWPSYLIALDPIYTEIKKIEYLLQTYEEVVKSIHDIDEKNLWQEDILWYDALIDYGKNSAITVLNALMIIEKKWIIWDTPIHSQVKNILIQKAEYMISLYYWHLIHTQNMHIYKSKVKWYTLTEQKLLHKYFTDRSSFCGSVRPEATHPLTILSSCLLVIKDHSNIQKIVSMPAWSTEIWILCWYLYHLRYPNSQIKNIFVPLSLHSYEYHTNQKENIFTMFLQQLQQHIDQSDNVLIVDDNSSTGNTIQTIKTLVQKVTNGEVYSFVTEADLVRTIGWWWDKKRKTVTSPLLFSYSTNILPVAQKGKQKDLKKEKEIQRLWIYYQNMSNNQTSPIKKILYAIYAQALSDHTKNHISPMIDFENQKAISIENQTHNTIVSFRNTVLSNFYPCKIQYKNIEYHSVEHAYQATKFWWNVQSKLTSQHINEINTILAMQLAKKSNRTTKRTKSVLIKKDDNIFTHPDLDGGDVKKISNYLSEQHIPIKKNRDNLKIEIMIDLLIQKYKQTPFLQYLQNTGDKYLIEWNSRWDQFWWWSYDNGIEKWNNFLGRIIMYIRDHSIYNQKTSIW
jgi:predicted NAD-dependent protein-ADP-ribosyltransferase YbiA (DUF1768 family)/hypoxanthine phosphoribosyltransferase